MTTKREFSPVIDALLRDRAVTLGGGKGFGLGALKVKGKIFATMSSKGQFVVKLSKERVDELVASGRGERFEPRPGKSMKEWLVVKADGLDWVQLAKESCEFVRRGKP